MTEIKGFIETSFIDWPGKVCAVVFLPGCNFRCPFCHNHPLVQGPDKLESFSLSEIFTRLNKIKKWLGGICISGGEPTLAPDLADILLAIRGEGFKVKMDTNGSRPEVLADLLERGLLDMVAMDVKAPLEQDKYDKCAGVRVDLDRIRQSITIIKQSGIDHEFRMTVLPKFHSREDVILWADTLGRGSCLKLQNFNSENPLNPALRQESGFGLDDFAEFNEIVGVERS